MLQRLLSSNRATPLRLLLDGWSRVYGPSVYLLSWLEKGGKDQGMCTLEVLLALPLTPAFPSCHTGSSHKAELCIALGVYTHQYSGLQAVPLPKDTTTCKKRILKNVFLFFF